MTEYVLKLTTFGRQESIEEAPRTGTVRPDRLAVFGNLKGRTIHCTGGYLWLTLGNEGMDRVIRAGQSLVVPSSGKAVIGGRGDYAVEQGGSLPKVS